MEQIDIICSGCGKNFSYHRKKKYCDYCGSSEGIRKRSGDKIKEYYKKHYLNNRKRILEKRKLIVKNTTMKIKNISKNTTKKTGKNTTPKRIE